MLRGYTSSESPAWFFVFLVGLVEGFVFQRGVSLGGVFMGLSAFLSLCGEGALSRETLMEGTRIKL